MIKVTPVEAGFIIQVTEEGLESIKGMSPAMTDIQKMQMLFMNMVVFQNLTMEMVEEELVLCRWVNIAWEKKNSLYQIHTADYINQEVFEDLFSGKPVTFILNDKLDSIVSRDTKMKIQIDHMGVHCPTSIHKFSIETNNRHQFLASLNEKLLAANHMLAKQSPYKADATRAESIQKISEEVEYEMDTCIMKMKFLNVISGNNLYSETSVSKAYADFRGTSQQDDQELTIESEGLNE